MPQAMNQNGKIYITISDRRLDAPQDEEQKKDPKEALRNYLHHKALDFVKNEAMTMVNYSLGNIGNFTGNYQTQAHIQEGMKAISILSNIAMAAAAGAKFGVGGAAAGAIFAFAAQGINLGLSEYGQYFANKKMNHNIRMVRQLSGLNSISDGSRGTME